MNSPCIGICQVDASGTCIGCGRTLDEITAWGVAAAGAPPVPQASPQAQAAPAGGVTAASEDETA